MTERHPDLVVAGGGPAGLAVAIEATACGAAVTVLDAAVGRATSLGEHLAPSSRSALERLGVWDEFCAGPHLPCFQQRSAWGSSEVDERSSIYNPYGAGWLIERPALDRTLRQRARRLGARVERGRVVDCTRTASGWRIGTDAGAVLDAAVVVDATGRRCRMLRATGGDVRMVDRLVAISAQYGPVATGLGPTGMLVESTPAGYWYSADGPGGGVVVVFVTEPGTIAAAGARDAWHACLESARHTAARLVGRSIAGRWETHSAGVQRGTAADDSRCVAVGDAALAVDPLSGSGLRRALESAAGAAAAALGLVANDPRPAAVYNEALDAMLATHLDERSTIYALEQRWPAATFWSDRCRLARV
jgi:2-polyprenyl-6-methoxyphenol hydroxylase-like FAD-dependent oxidoreductase